MVEVQKHPAAVAVWATEDEEEREARLKEIEDVAVQFILGDECRALMGGGKSPAAVLPSAAASPSDDGRPSSNAPEIARKLKGIGDDLDARVTKEIADATSALLSRRSVFQLGSAQFNRLCSGVLSNCSSVLQSGFQQVTAVYATLGQLARGVETQPSAESTVVVRRLAHFTGEYMAEVGLDMWLQNHGGLGAFLNDMGAIAAGDQVDIPPPDQ